MVQAKAPHGVDAPGRASVARRTLRRDKWWASPLVTWLLLSGWVAYALVRTVSQNHYFVEKYHYLSPFTSPCVTASCPPAARDFGTWFPAFPPFLPLAIISLVFLLGFRLTCYYYRKAYYRAFWRAPSACAVPEPHGKYHGETRFPLIFQNSHRYFFYAAVIISLVNTYDLVRAFHGGSGGIGMGLGTLIMLANVVLLWSYTLGCHHCRHAIGGRLRHFSKHPVRYRFWSGVSVLTGKHQQFAWITLSSLLITDLYIWLVASGVFADPRIFN